MFVSYEFDPYHLRVHELNYELRIRDVITDRVDNALKRKYLRRELKKDVARPDVQYITPDFNFNVEKAELDESIKSVSDLVDDFDGINEEVYNRSRSRIFHILGRLSRIPDNVSDELSHYRGDNIIRITALHDDLEEVVEQHRRGDLAGRASHTMVPTENPVVTKYIPVCKWGIVFDGNTSKLSLSSFLQRIEELRIARNCTCAELFQSASDLFEGIAREWFRSQSRQHRFDSWKTLTAALRQDFLPSDYDDQLWKEIQQRTQGQDERVVIYISIMENLFSCLGEPPSQEVKLKIIRKNLLPSYQPHLALQAIPDISVLTDICRSLEDADMLRKKFQPPPRNISVLEPGLAYRPPQVSSDQPSGSNACDGFQQHTPRRSINSERNNGYWNQSSRSKHIRQVAVVQCWRCNETGHLQRDCKRRILSCHGCGKLNVIRPNCPNCTKNRSGRSTQ